jgi:nanoRNase/pAp phosphatase (c-di-AMP/oligoRNAs hydrolase)
MLEYGGGGHDAAGTCQVPSGDADRVLAELVARLNADG